MNLNWDGYGTSMKNEQRVIPLPGGAPVQGTWHTYGVLWTATSYTFYADGAELWTTSNAVSRSRVHPAHLRGPGRDLGRQRTARRLRHP